MYFIAFLVALVVLAYSTWISVASKGKFLKSAVLHPFSFFGYFTALIGIDFLVLGENITADVPVIFSQTNLSSTPNLNDAAIIFILMSIVGAMGFTAGLAFPIRIPFVSSAFIRLDAERTRLISLAGPLVVILFLFVIFVIPTILPLLLSNGLLALASIRTVYLASSQVAYILLSSLVPAFFLFCAAPNSNRTIFVAFILMALIFILTGSRGSVVMMLIGLVVRLYHDKKIRALYVIISLMILIMIGYYYTYVTRFASQYSSIAVFWQIEGNPLSYMMNSSEMSIAEAMVLHVNDRIVERGAFDSILGALIAYVPRDIAPWKPVGLSTALTASIDMERWLLVRSEWTVSGYVNAVYELGIFGGLAFNAIFFFMLGGLYCFASQNRSHMIFIVSCEFYLILGYMRADIYNLGLRLWSIIFVVMIIVLCQFVARARVRTI